MFNLALQHEEYGDRALAMSLFRRILELDPTWTDALVRIAHAETVTDPDGDARASGFGGRCAARTSNRSTRESLHFALAKALDDCARYDEAFEQYALGKRGEPAALSRYDRYAVEQGATPDHRGISGRNGSRRRRLSPTRRSSSSRACTAPARRSSSRSSPRTRASRPAARSTGSCASRSRSIRPTGAMVAQGYLEHLTRTFPGAEIVTNKRPDIFG